jgi:hypothetical protein
VAVVAVSDSVNRLDDADALTNWVKVGAALAQEGDFVYQGSFSVSGKVGTSSQGHYLDVTSATGGTVDMTAAGDKVAMYKAIWTTSGILQSTPSAEVRIGSSTTNYNAYYIADDGSRGDIDYPVKGGWLISPIDPNVSAWPDVITATPPTLTAIDVFLTYGRFTTTSKAENVATDAVDLSDGLWLVGGDTAPAGTWQDFIDYDEGEGGLGTGSGVGDRVGHVSTLEGVIYLFGKFVIGRDDGATVTTTVFNDSLQTIVFPGGRVAAGWNEIEVDLGDTSTDVDFTNITHVGRGRTALKRFFDTFYEVDDANDEIDITAHGFLTGEAVIYNDEGDTGRESIGLTDGNEYFVEKVNDNSFSLHATRAGAFTPGTPVALTVSTGPNAQEHSLTRTPDTRPDLNITGAVGTFDANGCSFVNFRQINLTTAATLTGCNLTECQALDTDTNGGVLTGCVIDDATLVSGEAFIGTDDLEDITLCDFFEGPDGGHAIEIKTAGTYDSNNEFTGYGPGVETFHTTDDVDGTNEEIDIASHPYTTGEAVYYSDEGGTQDIGLTDQQKYYVQSVTSGSIALHLTKYGADNDVNRINLTAGGTETHALYSADAAIYNSSGGSVTINVVGGDVPTYRNSATSTTTVQLTVTVQVNGTAAGDRIGVYRLTGSGGSIDKGWLTSHASNNVQSDSTFEVTPPVPNDVPADGTIIVQATDEDEEHSYRYTAVDRGTGVFTLMTERTGSATTGTTNQTLVDSAATFQTWAIQVGDIIRRTNTPFGYTYVAAVDSQTQITTTSALHDWVLGDTYEIGSLVQNYDGSDTAYVPYIVKVATGSSVSVQVNYTTDRWVLTRFRREGFLPFEVEEQLTSTGYDVSIIRTPDAVYQ